MSQINSSSPLQPLWEAFLYSRDALKVTLTTDSYSIRTSECEPEIKNYQRHLLNHTKFDHINLEESLKKAQQENKDLFILALWANFERLLRDFLLSKGLVLQEHVEPSFLGTGLYAHYKKEVEYWNPEKILDFLKVGNIPSNLLGEAKQIYAYRNWVAHGKKEAEIVRINIQPVDAYLTLTAILNILQTWDANSQANN